MVASRSSRLGRLWRERANMTYSDDPPIDLEGLERLATAAGLPVEEYLQAALTAQARRRQQQPPSRRCTGGSSTPGGCGGWSTSCIHGCWPTPRCCSTSSTWTSSTSRGCDPDHLLAADEGGHRLVQPVEQLLTVEARGPLLGPDPVLQPALTLGAGRRGRAVRRGRGATPAPGEASRQDRGQAEEDEGCDLSVVDERYTYLVMIRTGVRQY